MNEVGKEGGRQRDASTWLPLLLFQAFNFAYDQVLDGDQEPQCKEDKENRDY